MSVVNQHRNNLKRLNQFEELVRRLRNDFLEFRDHVDVFFKNYLSILMGNSEEKRSDLCIQFTRLDLLCKKLNKFINDFLESVEQNYLKTSEIVRSLDLNIFRSRLKNDAFKEYNANVHSLNQQLEKFIHINNNLLDINNHALVYTFDDANFTLNINDYLKYFKSVVAADKMGNRENNRNLINYLNNMMAIFKKYKKISLETCGELTDPSALGVNKESPPEKCPLIPNANADNSGLEKEGRTVYIVNTCGFGSIAHILLASIIDDPGYELKILTIQSRESDLLLDLKANPENLVGMVKRYLLDTPGLKVEGNEEGRSTLNLNTDIVSIWNSYFRSLQSGVLKCPHKPTGGFKHSLFISYNEIGEVTINPTATGNVARKLSENKHNFVISEDCDGNCGSYLELGDQLFIDIMCNKQRLFSLDYFDPELLFNHHKFRLAGVIENVQEPSKHFVADVRRSNGTWELYNDSLSAVVPVDLKKQLYAVAVIYIKE